MRAQRTHHRSSIPYLMAAMITLAVGIGVLGFGIYIIDKAENSVIKYETTAIKKR